MVPMLSWYTAEFDEKAREGRRRQSVGRMIATVPRKGAGHRIIEELGPGIHDGCGLFLLFLLLLLVTIMTVIILTIS